MKGYYAIVYLVVIALLLVAAVASFRYTRNSYKELQELQLSYAVDYAVDAALEEVLNTGDLRMDYEALSKINISTKKALNTFLDLILFNMDIHPNTEDRQHLKLTSLPAFTIAGFDGYYLGELRKVTADTVNGDTGVEYDFVFSPKLPYTYTPREGVDIALNMGASNYLKMESGNLSKVEGLPEGIKSKEEVQSKINEIVQNATAYAIESRNELDSNLSNERSFYIPAGLTTITGANPLRGPSIITVLQNVDSGYFKANAYSVAGAELIARRFIVGYEVNNVKYYAYADKIDPLIVNEPTSHIFLNTREAAQAGYFPDLDKFR